MRRVSVLFVASERGLVTSRDRLLTRHDRQSDSAVAGDYELLLTMPVTVRMMLSHDDVIVLYL